MIPRARCSRFKVRVVSAASLAPRDPKRASVVSAGFGGFQWVSVGFSGFQWGSVGFSGFRWVSVGFGGFRWVSVGFGRLCWVVLGCVGLWWVFARRSSLMPPSVPPISFDPRRTKGGENRAPARERRRGRRRTASPGPRSSPPPSTGGGIRRLDRGRRGRREPDSRNRA